MKKTTLLFMICMLILSGCRTNGRQIDANFDINVYNDYMTKDENIDTINYLMTNDDKELSLLGNLIDGLVETDKYGNLKAAIAQDVGTSNGDDTVWEFSIKDDVLWVDSKGDSTGSYVKADDFVCGIQYVLDHKDSSYHNEVVSLIKNAKEYTEGKVKFSEVGVKAVNEYTIRYSLTRSCPYFNTYLLNGGFYPVSREVLNEMGKDFASSPSMMWYNGSYYLESMSEEKILFKKNALCWDVGQVSFESGTYTLVEDNQEALKLFEKGKLSYAYIDSTYAEKNAKSIDSHMYMSSTSKEVYAYLFNYDVKNENLKLALQNSDFRCALLYGMDVQSGFVVKSSEDKSEDVSLIKQDISAQSTIVPSEFVTTSTGADYLSLGSLSDVSSSPNYNLSESQSFASAAMLALADKVTFPVEISVPMDVDDEIALAEFERMTANIDPNFVVFRMLDYSNDSENKEIPSLDKVISNNEYGMVLMSINAEYGDPSTYLENFVSTNAYNDKYMGMKDEIYDALYNAASVIKNADARLKALAECEAYLITKGFVIPFSHGKLSYKVSSINDYSMPRGTYGLARYKLKGVKAIESAITTKERDEFKAAYEEAKNYAI